MERNRTCKKTRAIHFCALIITLCFFAHVPLSAHAQSPPQTGEIVFVLDASNSMNTNDPEHLAGDSLRQMLFSLPSNYDVGFVAYDTQITAAIPLTGSPGREAASKEIERVVYKGYTNAGEALTEAVEMFSAKENVSRAVILISDGEIVLNTPESTKTSKAHFDAAVQAAAARKIPIHIIGLGDEMSESDVSIFKASEQTGGKTWRAGAPDLLQKTLRDILFDTLNVKKSAVGVSTASGATDTLQTNIPAAHATKARVLLTADGKLENVTASYNAIDAKVITGRRFAVIEIDHPGKQEVSVQYQSKAGVQVQAEMITEHVGSLTGSAELVKIEPEKSTESRKEETPPPEKWAYNITVHLTDSDTPSILLLDDPYYEGKELPLSVDSQPFSLPINKGALKLSMESEGLISGVITVDFEGLDTNIIAASELELELPTIPVQAPPPPKDYRPLIAVLCSLIVAMAALLFWVLVQKKKNRPLPPEPVISRYEFAGKLNLYVIQLPDGSDVPPQTYNLHRLFSRTAITLQGILTDCGLKNNFEGAENIEFSPGANKSLVVTNNSDCTVLKGRELLTKKSSYPVYFGEKLTVTLEDEKSEIELHYKSVKPGEKG